MSETGGTFGRVPFLRQPWCVRVLKVLLARFGEFGSGVRQQSPLIRQAYILPIALLASKPLETSAYNCVAFRPPAFSAMLDEGPWKEGLTRLDAANIQTIRASLSLQHPTCLPTLERAFTLAKLFSCQMRSQSRSDIARSWGG